MNDEGISSVLATPVSSNIIHAININIEDYDSNINIDLDLLLEIYSRKICLKYIIFIDYIFLIINLIVSINNNINIWILFLIPFSVFGLMSIKFYHTFLSLCYTIYLHFIIIDYLYLTIIYDNLYLLIIVFIELLFFRYSFIFYRSLKNINDNTKEYLKNNSLNYNFKFYF